jgi:hypothetical protein
MAAAAIPASFMSWRRLTAGLLILAVAPSIFKTELCPASFIIVSFCASNDELDKVDSVPALHARQFFEPTL